MKRIFCFIFYFISSFVNADNQYKDWYWSINDEAVAYAKVINNQNSTLGQYCYYGSGMCRYMFNLSVTCKEKDEYVGLVNSDIGVFDISLYCVSSSDGGAVFFVGDFDYIDKIVRESDNIAMAVAIDAGYFKVVRFSLAGSIYAIEMMLSGFRERKGRKPFIFKPESDEQYL